MSQYSDIEALENILNQHTITIGFAEEHPNFLATENHWIDFHLDGQSFLLLVDDEYKDFAHQYAPLNLCLVLRELETYEEADDILQWCNFKGLDVANSEVLEYYKGLSQLYLRIEKLLGTIDSHISDFDFSLNAGEAQELRRRAKEH